VKTYSSVFAVTPFAAGRIAANFERVEQREINDLDEAAYRAGLVRAEPEGRGPMCRWMRSCKPART